MGDSERANRTPAMAFLDHHVDVRKLREILPCRGPIFADNRIYLFLRSIEVIKYVSMRENLN